MFDTYIMEYKLPIETQLLLDRLKWEQDQPEYKKRQEEEFVRRTKATQTNADKAIASCQQMIADSKDPAEGKFVQELKGYLSNRKAEYVKDWDNLTEITNRSTFIQGLIPLMKRGDVAGQIDMLKEENIKPFKGFWSKRLYNIFVTRREELKRELQSESRYQASLGMELSTLKFPA
ncbi:hypothetical protein BH10PSE19_BH10PSE19_03050 [soil metagenome]